MPTKNYKRFMVSLAINVVLVAACIYASIKALEYRAHINEFLYKYTHVVEEFSSRSTYLRDNTRLASKTIVPGRIVFFGMTVTQTWPVEKFFPDYEAINRGVAMQRLAGMPLRFRSDVIRLMPEWVVIEASSYNLREPNSLEELTEYIADMAELADYHGIKPILTTLIPPTGGYEPYESDYAVFDSLAVFNTWLRSYAKQHQFTLVDVHALMAGENNAIRVDLADGGIIPNQEGYRIISDAIRSAIVEDSSKSR